MVKKEKRQKTDSFASKGHVLKETQPEPMEVDSVGRENTTPVEQQEAAEEDEDNMDDFVFVRNCTKR